MLKTFNLHLSNTCLMIKHLQTECIYLKLPKVQKKSCKSGFEDTEFTWR